LRTHFPNAVRYHISFVPRVTLPEQVRDSLSQESHKGNMTSMKVSSRHPTRQQRKEIYMKYLRNSILTSNNESVTAGTIVYCTSTASFTLALLLVVDINIFYLTQL